MFCREYPQRTTNEKISQTVRQFLEEHISQFCGIQDLWKVKFRGCINKKTHLSAQNSFHYEDFSNTSDPYSNFNFYVRHSGKKQEKLMILGSEVKCPQCNKHPATNGRIVCESCIDELYNKSRPKSDKDVLIPNDGIFVTADRADRPATIDLGGLINRPRRTANPNADAPAHVVDTETVRGGEGNIPTIDWANVAARVTERVAERVRGVAENPAAEIYRTRFDPFDPIEETWDAEPVAVDEQVDVTAEDDNG